MQISIMLAQFPGGASTHPDVTDWVLRTCLKAARDPRISRIEHLRIVTTPITKGRNEAVVKAKLANVDYLLMVDSDMCPDHLAHKPFWDSSIDWLFANHLSKPCMIFAPYVGPPPFENVYVFRLGNHQSEHRDCDFKIDQFTREDAADRGGVEQVVAGPTGLILMDMRVFKILGPDRSYFYYEYTDKYEWALASTEDVTFTRDCSFAGIPVYCNWDAWAGHWKMKKCGKPQPLHVDELSKNLVETIRRNSISNEKLIALPKQVSPERAAALKAEYLAAKDHEIIKDILTPSERAMYIAANKAERKGELEEAEYKDELNAAAPASREGISHQLPPRQSPPLSEIRRPENILAGMNGGLPQ